MRWLIFTHALAVMGRTLDPQFVADFEDARRRAKSASRDLPPALNLIVRTYNDRASYRVNDTLSVRLRDLALNAAYASLGPDSDYRGLGSLVSRLPEAEVGDNGRELVRFIDESNWDLPK